MENGGKKTVAKKLKKTVAKRDPAMERLQKEEKMRAFLAHRRAHAQKVKEVHRQHEFEADQQARARIGEYVLDLPLDLID